MLEWIVAGIGDITRKRVLPAILAEPRSRLAGIVTRDPAKAQPYGVPAWPDLETALATSNAAALYIATPVFLHAPQTNRGPARRPIERSRTGPTPSKSSRSL